ncbi:MAG: aminodeoxychorismate/anthranilate synthase component II [Bifidobacteriaceae bacterium]|jgi:anthranilate synthase component 2|nr:aminodeoxychorismate/anthranilate synthase component II [Bifidobacteriaceae bacterium]
MILIIDNYDSFTYNIFQQVGSINSDVKVVKNDEYSAEEIANLKPRHIIFSPGPGEPKDAGMMEELLKYYKDRFDNKTDYVNTNCKLTGINSFERCPNILGICLGHQAIAEVFGGKVVHAKNLIHGKASKIVPSQNAASKNDATFTYPNILNDFFDNNNLSVARYHSLTVSPESLGGTNLIATSFATSDDELMSLQHTQLPIYGLQFHPESILTGNGDLIIKKFLEL